jgi:hypothetical protein
MELKEFVKTVLQEIVDGISEVQEYAIEKNAVIAPIKVTTNPASNSIRAQDTAKMMNEPNIIEFELLLCSTDTNKSKSGIGVFLTQLGMGKEQSKSNESSAYSKIKFSVPVIYPVQKHGDQKNN